MAQGIEEIEDQNSKVESNGNECTKFIHRGILYIMRNGETYDVIGRQMSPYIR